VPRPWRLILAAALLPAVGMEAVGCGGQSTRSPAGLVQVALNEYRLNPDSVSVRAGTVTVVARNYGRLTHNLVVSRDGHPEAAIRPLAPGQTGETTTVLTPGTYQMNSNIQSDQALGVSGALTVTR
jgi:plastocyanin